MAQGSVESTVDTEEEGEVVQCVHGPGSCVGELSFFFGVRQTENAKTSQAAAVLLYVLSRSAYDELAKLCDCLCLLPACAAASAAIAYAGAQTPEMAAGPGGWWTGLMDPDNANPYPHPAGFRLMKSWCPATR